MPGTRSILGMRPFPFLCIAFATGLLAACGTLQEKSMGVKTGDTPATVLAIMGTPVVRQSHGQNEAWQYGESGSGFAHHDNRVIWFFAGKVTGITFYENDVPGTAAPNQFKQIRWEDAPAPPH